jgi:hypothetical protein
VAQGFKASTALTVKVGGVSATVTGGSPTGTNGSASGIGSTLAFTIPAVPAGAQSVIVSDGTNSVTSSTNFTVTSSATGLSPTTGPVGTSATIVAQGFLASTALTVKVGGVSATVTGDSPTGTNGSATGTGSTLTFTIPTLSAGPQSVIVSDGTNSVTSSTNFTVNASATGLSPATGPVGTSATIVAQGFKASTALTVKVGGVSATVTGGSPTGTNGSASGTGSTLAFTIPTLSLGAQTVVVSDGTNSATSSTNFTVTTPLFGATDLGNNGSSPCTTLSSHACNGPIVTTTSGRTELILVFLSGSNETGSTMSSISGPFTGASQVTSTAVGNSSEQSYAYAWTAAGNGMTGTTVVTFDHGTTSMSGVVVDVVELGVGNSVVNSGTNANSSSKSINAQLTVQNGSDGEVAFMAYDDNELNATPNGFVSLGNIFNNSGGFGYGTYSSSTVTSSASGALSSKAPWGTIALEVSL